MKFEEAAPIPRLVLLNSPPEEETPWLLRLETESHFRATIDVKGSCTGRRVSARRNSTTPLRTARGNNFFSGTRSPK
jgi:hypothetical protein